MGKKISARLEGRRNAAETKIKFKKNLRVTQTKDYLSESTATNESVNVCVKRFSLVTYKQYGEAPMFSLQTAHKIDLIQRVKCSARCYF